MNCHLISCLLVVGMFSGTLPCFSQEARTADSAELAAAQTMLQSGNVSGAIQKYQQILKSDPKLVPAQAGLILAYLRQEQVDPAFELAKSSLAAQPNSAQLLAAMGSVQYRRGEIPESEASFISAKKVDPNLVEAYLGLARVYRTALFYRRSYDAIKRAHELAPQNPDVQRAWLGTLPRRERLKALEAYLAAPHPENEEENASLHAWLDYLKATVDKPVHACKLANDVESTETTMEILYATPSTSPATDCWSRSMVTISACFSTPAPVAL